MSGADSDEHQPKKRRPPRRGKLTKTAVEKIPLPPAGAREYLWDVELPGFGVMVTPSGTRSYIVQYTIGGRKGKPSRYTIGHHGKPFTTEQARSEARSALLLIKRGIDPNEQKRQSLEAIEARRRIAEDLNFNKLADTYLSKKSKLRSIDELTAVFRRELRPRYGHLSILEIGKDMVHDMNDEIGERSESAANKAFSKLKTFMEWVSDQKSDHYPHSAISKMKKPYAEGRRTRFFKGPEIGYFWAAVSNLPVPYRQFVQLLLLTGLRLREAARGHFNEIDFSRREWIIPAARSKNKREHLVPLSDRAMEVLLQLAPTPSARRGFVFTLNGIAPINSFSKLKEAIDAELVKAIDATYRSHGHPLDEAMTLQDWVFHDLRRTLATNLQMVGVPITTTEVILSHTIPGTSGASGHYHLYEYAREKRDALEQWAALIWETVCDDEDFEVPLIPYEGDALEESAAGLLEQEGAAVRGQMDLFGVPAGA